MPIDTSMYSQLRSPDPINPEKILTLAQVARQGQMNDLAFQDQMATRNAFKNNLVTDQNGNTTVNRQGVLSDLMKQNPQKAMEAAQSFRQMDLARLHDQTQLANELAAQATPDNWGQIRQQAQTLGLDNADKLPQAYDPKFVDSWKMHTQNAKDQFAQVVAQQNAQSERGKTNAALSEAGQPTLPALTGGSGAGSPAAPSGKSGGSSVGSASGLGFNPPPKMQQSALNEAQGKLESARGESDLTQALLDRYNAKKLKDVISLDGNPDNLNPQMVAIAGSEIGKIAKGGTPDREEFAIFNQNNIPKALASAAQVMNAQSTPANQASFLKEYNKYADVIAANANKTISNRYSRVIEGQKNWLNKSDYSNLNNIYLNPFQGSSMADAGIAGALAAHPQDGAAITWAKANPNDPRAAKIIQMNGGGG